MAGGNIVLQIRLGICRRWIKCLGRHAQSEIWPQQGQAYGRPDTCREALQTPRLQFKHLRSILVPGRNQELPAAPWDSHNTEHSAIDALLAFHATSTILVEEIADHMGIAAEQASDDTFKNHQSSSVGNPKTGRYPTRPQRSSYLVHLYWWSGTLQTHQNW